MYPNNNKLFFHGVTKLVNYEKSELLAGACIIPPVIIVILNAWIMYFIYKILQQNIGWIDKVGLNLIQ